jgi:hypothetical protein
MFCIAKLVAGGLINRYGAAARGRVGRLPGVQLASVEAQLAFGGHEFLLILCLI